MDWLFSVIRIAGASLPGASSLLQLQAEIDSKKLLERVKKLEDPVSFLHEDIPELARLIYSQLRTSNSKKVVFESEFYAKYSRPLAALAKHGCIEGIHAIGASYVGGIWLRDPVFVMYMCALEENRSKMESLVKLVDDCRDGQWLKGENIRETIDLPMPVIAAVFEIYESKGYGFCSKEIGATTYMGQA